MKKVAILVFNYFEKAELAAPLQTMTDAGIEVHVISASGETELQSMEQDVNKSNTFHADKQLDSVEPADYDALVVPGGTVNADKLRGVTKAQTWAKNFMEERKPVAVICHGPWLLVSAGVAAGKRLTSFPSLQDDLKNAGAAWVDEEVVIDGNLITSRNPDDLPAFCNAIVASLN